jgi:hypothetical protein
VGAPITARVTPATQPTITWGTPDITDTSITWHFTIDWGGRKGTCRRQSGPTGTPNCDAGTFAATGLNASSPYTLTLCAKNADIATETCVGNQQRTKAPPGKAVVIDASYWLGQTATADICNGVDGVGAQVSPASKTNASRCIPNGRTETLTCQVQGVQLKSDLGRGRQVFTRWWFRTSRGDYVSAMWVQGSAEPDTVPGRLGLPNC